MQKSAFIDKKSDKKLPFFFSVHAVSRDISKASP
jgi:hypothetical protein